MIKAKHFARLSASGTTSIAGARYCCISARQCRSLYTYEESRRDTLLLVLLLACTKDPGEISVCASEASCTVSWIRFLLSCGLSAHLYRLLVGVSSSSIRSK